METNAESGAVKIQRHGLMQDLQIDLTYKKMLME
jgi:hypothetical protein